MNAFSTAGMVVVASAAVLLLQVGCWHQVLEGRQHYKKMRGWLFAAAVIFPLSAVVHLGVSRFFGEDVSLAKVMAAIAGPIWMAMLCLWGQLLAAKWRGFTDP